MGGDYLTPTIITVGADMMPQVRLTGHPVDRQRWPCQGIMGATHAAFGGSFAALLYSHESILGLLVHQYRERREGISLLRWQRLVCAGQRETMGFALPHIIM